ncbi:unnamed protein product, partial [Gongylonema pulchrum]|uniref:Helitron_like_N domain-containing protein n=1 Tax=Gongylonema pulchrum TaxID=637853 RepID=A0A183DQF0_9BILA
MHTLTCQRVALAAVIQLIRTGETGPYKTTDMKLLTGKISFERTGQHRNVNRFLFAPQQLRLISFSFGYEELEKSRIYLESIRGKMLVKEEQRRDQRIQAVSKKLPDAITVTRWNDRANTFDCPSDQQQLHPKGACNGPRFRDITTVTSQQLGAFLSIFAVSRGLPLCSICDSMVNKAEAVLFEPGSKELPNQFLLNESRIQSFMDMFTTRYLSGFCAKVCHLFQPNIFWDGIGYTDCMSSTTNYLKDLLQKAATVFMPEKFCFE